MINYQFSIFNYPFSIVNYLEKQISLLLRSFENDLNFNYQLLIVNYLSRSFSFEFYDRKKEDE